MVLTRLKFRLGRRRWGLPRWLRPQYGLILPVVGIGVGLALSQRERWTRLTRQPIPVAPILTATVPEEQPASGGTN
jgi:hypothetical protein